MAVHTRKKTNDRITTSALSYYVPLFKAAEAAEERILNENVSIEDRNELETRARLKELVLSRIAELSGPLITSEINKLISGSHLQHSEDLFEILYYAGMSGLTKGLSNFDESKMNESATNYLFQWFVVYAKRELNVIEAPYGIAPSRFAKYKKISAVRKKLTEQLARTITNQEIFEYFQSGSADLKTMTGRLGSSDNASQANKNITLELIIEQEDFEKNFLVVALLDPLEDYSTNVKLSRPAEEHFSETLFGTFIIKYGINDNARLVLMSELSSELISDEDALLVSKLDIKEYRSMATAWKALIRDPQGPFYEYLKNLNPGDFAQLDIKDTIEQIETNNRSASIKKYKILFS